MSLLTAQNERKTPVLQYEAKTCKKSSIRYHTYAARTKALAINKDGTISAEDENGNAPETSDRMVKVTTVTTKNASNPGTFARVNTNNTDCF